jgi:hypothetical protein
VRGKIPILVAPALRGEAMPINIHLIIESIQLSGDVIDG